MDGLLTHPSPRPCSSWQQELIACQAAWEPDELPELQELFLEVKPGPRLGASSSDEVKVLLLAWVCLCQELVQQGMPRVGDSWLCSSGTGAAGGCRTGKPA